MSYQLARTFTIILMVSLISALLSIITLSTIIEQKKDVHDVVEVHQVILATDKQRINLFISELMTTKAATCFRKILTVESHTNPAAKNPTSSARGVGQLLSSTYQNIGLKHSSDGLAQVIATIAYISKHYGSGGTCAAWAHERTSNWY